MEPVLSLLMFFAIGPGTEFRTDAGYFYTPTESRMAVGGILAAFSVFRSRPMTLVVIGRADEDEAKWSNAPAGSLLVCAEKIDILRGTTEGRMHWMTRDEVLRGGVVRFNPGVLMQVEVSVPFRYEPPPH